MLRHAACCIPVFQTPELSIQDSHERYARFDHRCTVVALPIRKRHVVAVAYRTLPP